MSRARTLATVLGSDGSLGSTDITAALGYTPRSSNYGDGLLTTASGLRWLRVAHLAGRFSYRVTAGTVGGYYGPGAVTFTINRDWSNNLYIAGVTKVGSIYADQVRANSTTADQDWYLEIRFNSIHPSSGNGSTQFDGFSYVLVEPLGSNNSVKAINSGVVPTDPASLGYISGPLTL